MEFEALNAVLLHQPPRLADAHLALPWVDRGEGDQDIAVPADLFEDLVVGKAPIAGLTLSIDGEDHGGHVLFPEMRPDSDPPEITTACWDILNKDPNDLMCASQRMVVKRKGAEKASVLACTLLPYDPEFELGETLADARRDVLLNHSYCATFCVLGGGSCSA